MANKAGRISLWNERDTENGRPVMTGSVEIGNRRYRVSLWENDGGSPNGPAFKGEVEVPRSLDQRQ